MILQPRRNLILPRRLQRGLMVVQPHRFGSAATFTWDPTGIAAPFSLSNGNRRLTMATGQTSNTTHVKALNALMTVGKYYWEVTVVDLVNGATGTTGIGMEKSGAASWLGSDVHGVGRWPQGSLFRSGAAAVTGMATIVDGSVLMFAYDGTAGALWCGRNGTWHGGGDPAAGTGATYSSSLSGNTWSVSTTPYTSSGETVVLELSSPSAPTYSVPSGFTHLAS